MSAGNNKLLRDAFGSPLPYQYYDEEQDKFIAGTLNGGADGDGGDAGPVTSLNGKKGAVILSASDVGATSAEELKKHDELLASRTNVGHILLYNGSLRIEEYGGRLNSTVVTRDEGLWSAIPYSPSQRLQTGCTFNFGNNSAQQTEVFNLLKSYYGTNMSTSGITFNLTSIVSKGDYKQHLDVFQHGVKILKLNNYSISMDAWGIPRLNLCILTGTGSPEGNVNAIKGSLYRDLENLKLYKKTDGLEILTNTGWVLL